MSDPFFVVGHVSHPDADMAAALVAAQLRGRWQARAQDERRTPTLGLIYFTDHLVPQAEALLAALRTCLPEVPQWLGTVGFGVLAEEAEYFDEPALAVMLCDLSPGEFRLFSGRHPMPPGFEAHTAWVHADSGMTELAENLRELSARMASGTVFGGLSTSRSRAIQWVQPAGQAHAEVAEMLLTGGLSGVAFTNRVAMQSRLTHGCKPVGPERVLTDSKGTLMLALNGEPALDLLLDDLHVSLSEPRQALVSVRQTLLAINPNPLSENTFAGQLAAHAHVRALVGVDPARSGLALAEAVPEGTTVRFCQRDEAYARADLRRVCAQLRDALEPDELDEASVAKRLQWQAQGEQAFEPGPWAPQRIAGALYVSCVSRGGGYFGGPGAEMKLLRHALGEVPLIGLLAGGEIAHGAVHGFSGVLTLFLGDDSA